MSFKPDFNGSLVAKTAFKNGLMSLNWRKGLLAELVFILEVLLLPLLADELLVTEAPLTKGSLDKDELLEGDIV